MDATPSRRVFGGPSWWPRTGLLVALALAGALVQGCSDNNGRVTGTESKVTGDAIGGNIKVSVTINPGVIDVGRRGSVVVIVSSPNGFPLVGRRVDLSSLDGRLDATTGITDANGRFTTTILVTCNSATGTVTVTAFADNQSQVAATATANVAPSATSSPCPAGAGPAPGGGGGGAPVLPVVSITSAGTATEAGATGTFTVTRTGSTAAPLGVTLASGGSATFGTDYGLTGSIVGTTVTIPAGSTSTVITLNSVDDPDAEADDPSGPNADAELAILSITPSGTYTVGVPGAAQVEIVDND